MRIRKGQLLENDISMTLTTPPQLCDPAIQQENRLPPRATLIPAQKSGVCYRNRSESDRLLSLNGEYRFALFDDAAAEDCPTPALFAAPGFDDSDWDTLDVPSMWQYRGYSQPTYPNVEYPFPFYPPLILRRNPVGCYRRHFTVHRREDLPRAILHFEGIDSAGFVWLNGQYVGFSKGSRLPAEYDVSALLREGDNLLAVQVFTYCDGSYLENQDMLLASGIFRDVYLLQMPECAIWDLDLAADTAALRCRAALFAPCADAAVRFTLDGESRTVPAADGCAETVFAPQSPRLWTAETPALYDLTVEVLLGGTVMETHFKRVGFRSCTVAPSRLLVNGSPILLRGINRHENDPDNGRAIRPESIETDLKLLKSHNINAIRCSHYPNHPAFYEWASELGLYVMDEGDLETHGCHVTGDQGYLSKHPDWREAYLDRTRRMAERDKNETCIIIRSVGNEYGEGSNADACAAWLRERFGMPVQFSASPAAKNDFCCTGYPSSVQLRDFAAAHDPDDPPMLLLEYAHAMGNSPGNLAGLWDIVTADPAFAGGYVWEFRSHGKRCPRENGTDDYLYGGDFHDTNHWSNFTLDGYLTSNSTPKPTFEELKTVYAPIRFALQEGTLSVRNLQDFTDLSGLVLHAQLRCDGRIAKEAFLSLPPVPPHETAPLALPLPQADGTDCQLTLTVLQNGRIFALQQFSLPAAHPAPVMIPDRTPVTVRRDGTAVTVSGSRFLLRFADGVPVRYEKDGMLWFDSPMRFIPYRAETDNDGIAGLYPRWIGSWERARLPYMRFFCRSCQAENTSDGARIHTDGVLTADHCYTGFSIGIDFAVDGSGVLQTAVTVRPYGKMPTLDDCDVPARGVTGERLPRFGVCFELDKSLDTVRWFGRGPAQNYTDSHAAAPIGVYRLPASEMNFAYDVPQETGTRTDVRWARIQDDRRALTVYGSPCFSFQLHPWQLDELRRARHPSELHEADRNYLYIDYRMRALGSYSCGPNPEKEDDFVPHDFRFVFALNGEETEQPPCYAGQRLFDTTRPLSGEYRYTPFQAARGVVECLE